MRFLVDECTGPKVSEWLATQGHDVFSAYDQSRGASDADLLRRAVSDDRIVITNDRDFGEMIFRDGLAHCGVVFLRLNDERSANKVHVIADLLATHADQLSDRFVVVTDTQVRFASDRAP